MPLAPDARWDNICGGITASGGIREMSVEVLQELTLAWATIVEGIDPFGGTELLARARSLVVGAWFDYEQLVTACLVGLQAVEATFRQVVFPDARKRVSFRQLVNRAEQERIFSFEEVEVLRAGVELRNLLSHPGGAAAFSLGLAESTLRRSHQIVRDACAARGVIPARSSAR